MEFPSLSLFYSFSFPFSVLFFTIASIQTKIALAVFGLYIGSLLSSLIIGIIFFREKFTGEKLLSLSLTVLGLLFLTYPLSLTTVNMGILLGLLAGCFEGIANAFRKQIAGKKDRFVLAGYQSIGGIIVSGGLLLIAGQTTFPALSAATIIVTLLFGLILMSVMVLLLVGFKNFDLNLGTIVLSSELVFSLIFGILFFSEYPKTAEIIGGSCILAAISIPSLKLLFGKGV